MREFSNRRNPILPLEYHVVSTADMEHWTIHEESLNGNQIPWFNNPVAPNIQELIGVIQHHLSRK